MALESFFLSVQVCAVQSFLRSARLAGVVLFRPYSALYIYIILCRVWADMTAAAVRAFQTVNRDYGLLACLPPGRSRGDGHMRAPSRGIYLATPRVKELWSIRSSHSGRAMCCPERKEERKNSPSHSVILKRRRQKLLVTVMSVRPCL